MKDAIFILVGPSASGKTTVAQLLVERLGLRRATTTTTRERRAGEPLDAYNFVSKENFSAEDMVECQEYAGNYYGLSKKEADTSNLVIMEPIGAKKLQAYCKTKGRPCYIIGLQASKQEQAERMLLRGDSARMIDERIAFDAAVLSLYLGGFAQLDLAYLEAADLNQDGTIDERDYQTLRNMLSGTLNNYRLFPKNENILYSMHSV